MDKTNFLLYKDFKPNIDILSDEQAGRLIKAVFAYVDGRIEPNFTDDGMLLMAFTMLKTTLERDLLKYKEQVKRNQENGRKGGRPKKTEWVNEKPSGFNENPKNPPKPKKADSDSVSDTVSVNDNDLKEKDKKKPRSFKKPTVEEIESYCKERNNGINAQQFYDFYESKGWYVGKTKMKDWKASVRTWERREKDNGKNKLVNDLGEDNWFDDYIARQ